MITNSHKEIELCVTEDGNRRHSKDKYCKRRERWRDMERERETEREREHARPQENSLFERKIEAVSRQPWPRDT